MSEHLLSLLILLPLLALVVMLFVPARYTHIFRTGTVVVLVIELSITLIVSCLYNGVSSGTGGFGRFYLVERYDWLSIEFGSRGTMQVDYFLGVDGLSMPMVLLTAIIFLIAGISSWPIQKQVKGYHILLMLLCSAVMGCFMALDMFLFYVFFEFMLLPMFFLIGIWGGVRREYASLKFFIYTLAGSLLILAVMIGLYLSVQEPGLDVLVHSFSIPTMMDADNFIVGSVLSSDSAAKLFGLPLRLIAFLAVFIGFAIKIPAVPFHTWLPDAHVEAPTAISIVLAGVLLKVGAYGLIRIGYGIFPEGGLYFAEFVGGLGVLSIVYAGLVALAQHDLKRMVAYSSVSHMGFVLLGIAAVTSEGLDGAIFMMFSHGIISAALFLICGVLYDRTGDRMIAHFGGLHSIMPRFTAVVMLTFFASLGLPGLSNFVGELLVLLGAFEGQVSLLPKWIPILAISGIVISAAYYLWALQRMFFGPFWRFRDMDNHLPDLNARELTMLLPLLAMMLCLGLYPMPLLEWAEPFARTFTEHVRTDGGALLQLMNIAQPR